MIGQSDARNNFPQVSLDNVRNQIDLLIQSTTTVLGLTGVASLHPPILGLDLNLGPRSQAFVFENSRRAKKKLT